MKENCKKISPKKRLAIRSQKSIMFELETNSSCFALLCYPIYKKNYFDVVCRLQMKTHWFYSACMHLRKKSTRFNLQWRNICNDLKDKKKIGFFFKKNQKRNWFCFALSNRFFHKFQRIWLCVCQKKKTWELKIESGWVTWATANVDLDSRRSFGRLIVQMAPVNVMCVRFCVAGMHNAVTLAVAK